MSIRDRNDAIEVERAMARVFSSPIDARAGEIRRLFVEVLDFEPALGQVVLHPVTGNASLPGAAERVATRDGVYVLYVPLHSAGPDQPATDRVRKGDADAAAKLIADQLGEDILLVFTNPSSSQLHLILPDFNGPRTSLRRMVVERHLPRRTAVQQVSNIYWQYRDKGNILTALKAAFDVEPVTKEFFQEYKRVHDMTLKQIQGFGTGGEEGEFKNLFVQTLFNRLMFIYFLSRKGWLTFPRDDSPSDDAREENDYLNALWSDYQSQPEQNKNFHTDRLQPLFFAGLNNPQSRT